MVIKDGISKNEEGKYIFDYTQDLNTDILHLCKDESGLRETENLSYFCAYRFNEDADPLEVKTFRKLFKHNYNDPTYFYEDSVFDFIESGMFYMDRYKKLDSFDIVFMTDYSNGETDGVMSVLDSLLLEYTGGTFMDVRLVKATYDSIKFDREKAKEALLATDRYSFEEDAERAVKNIERTFYNMKRKGELFKIKRFLPVKGRVGFYDFLEFDTEEHKRIFQSLETGSEALICDDFITSGSTVKEIQRYLRSINPDVNLTVFVLIDQLRDY